EYIFTFNIPINDRFSFYDADGVAISVAKNWNSDNTQLTFKMGNVDGYIGGKFYPIEQNYPVEIYLMAEKGNKATDWTPAPEDNPYDTLENNLYKTNILLSEPLRSVGDVKDRLFRDSDGLWKVERNLVEYKADGSETWRQNASDPMRWDMTSTSF